MPWRHGPQRGLVRFTFGRMRRFRTTRSSCLLARASRTRLWVCASASDLTGVCRDKSFCSSLSCCCVIPRPGACKPNGTLGLHALGRDIVGKAHGGPSGGFRGPPDPPRAQVGEHKNQYFLQGRPSSRRPCEARGARLVWDGVLVLAPTKGI